MKKEFRRIFSAAADEIFESDAPFRLFRCPNEIDFPGVRRPKPDDPHPLPLVSSVSPPKSDNSRKRDRLGERDHSANRDKFGTSSGKGDPFEAGDRLDARDKATFRDNFQLRGIECERQVTSDEFVSSCRHNNSPHCLLRHNFNRCELLNDNFVAFPQELNCTKLDVTLSRCCPGLRQNCCHLSPSTSSSTAQCIDPKNAPCNQNSGKRRDKSALCNWILGDEPAQCETVVERKSAQCGRFPVDFTDRQKLVVEKTAPCAQFSGDEPALCDSFYREGTAQCIAAAQCNVQLPSETRFRRGRESRGSQLIRMLLPWSNTAEKLASGRQTPATPSPLVTDGTTPNGLYQFADITPGQFGLTKQLVLRITLPHISLLLISIGYALAGCWILTAINYNADSVEAMDLITDTKMRFLREIKSNMASSGYNEFANSMEDPFTNFASGLYKVYSKFPRSTAVLETARGNTNDVMKGPLTNVTWNLFFVTTTLTSIGYGANAPDSLVGRLFCVIYILFGVPLYLITLADLAKFCTEGMNRSYTEYLKFKHSMKMKYKRWKIRKNQKPNETKDSEESESFDVERVIIAGGENEVAEFLWTHLENTQFVEIPFILIYIILLSYIAAASYLIAYLENWTTQKGFYFVMMSVLTIGFGDVVPSKDKHVLLILFTLLLGLIITTTCIDIVGAYYIDQLHFFGRRIEIEDPLMWLKAVQQKRINAMKREAMRKLFETVAALNRLHFDPASLQQRIATDDPESAIIKLTEITGEPPNHFRNSLFPDPPPPPTNLKVFNPTADSISLKWDPPEMVEEAKRYWYTLSYKTRTPQRRPNATVIDFVNQNHYEMTDLKSFTLYEFSVATTTRYGSSKPIKCQEYTEPCTVPQSLKLEAIGAEKATISWKAPRKNKALESYVVMFTKDPMPPTTQWTRFRVGRVKRFTFSDLQPENRYICAVTAEHNAGLATMSKTLRFRTKTRSSLKNPQFDQEEDSIAVNMAVEQASHSPTPSMMWRPQPFFAQIQNALQTHFLSSPLRFRFLTETSSRDFVVNDTDDN